MFGGDLKVMGNSFDCNMMSTETSENLFNQNLFDQVSLFAGHL